MKTNTFEYLLQPNNKITKNQRNLKVLMVQVFKVGLSPCKKSFNVSICFNEDAFYFILKAHFVLKIFTFLFCLFGHVEKTAWLEIQG